PPDLPDRRYALFGEGGGRRLAEEIGVPVLAEVPLEQAAREAGDAGLPVVLREPDGAAARAFVGLAERVEEELERRAGEPKAPPVEILYR
ncbi:MAG TPA: P-loop NTPase, partial [Rubricoccaceae bacterium]